MEARDDSRDQDGDEGDVVEAQVCDEEEDDSSYYYVGNVGDRNDNDLEGDDEGEDKGEVSVSCDRNRVDVHRLMKQVEYLQKEVDEKQEMVEELVEKNATLSLQIELSEKQSNKKIAALRKKLSLQKMVASGEKKEVGETVEGQLRAYIATWEFPGVKFVGEENLQEKGGIVTRLFNKTGLDQEAFQLYEGDLRQIATDGLSKCRQHAIERTQAKIIGEYYMLTD